MNTVSKNLCEVCGFQKAQRSGTSWTTVNLTQANMFLQGFSCFLPLTSFRTKQANVTEDSSLPFPLLRLTCLRRHCHILLFSLLGEEKRERGMNYNPIFVCLNSTEFLIFCPETFLLSSVSLPPLFPLFVHLPPPSFFVNRRRRGGRRGDLPFHFSPCCFLE